MTNRLLVLVFLLIASLAAATAQEEVNKDINDLIRKHGLEQSQAMEIAGWITDVYGPRLTGSPMLDKATEWAQNTLTEWGMTNVHLESWGPFGRGWELAHALAERASKSRTRLTLPWAVAAVPTES